MFNIRCPLCGILQKVPPKVSECDHRWKMVRVRAYARFENVAEWQHHEVQLVEGEAWHCMVCHDWDQLPAIPPMQAHWEVLSTDG